MLMDVPDDLSDFQKKVVSLLDELFEKAFKSKFDFLFIQTLFGAHPLCLTCTKGAAASIMETIKFVDNFKKLVLKRNLRENLRIGLIIYCHIYETNFIPRIIHNLITVQQGILDCFPFKLTNNKWEMSPDRKIKQIAERDSVVGELMKGLYDSNIRNAFCHSDYFFTDGSIILTADMSAKKNIIPNSKLISKLDNMFFFFDAFVQIWQAYKRGIYNNGDVIYGHSTAERYKLIVDSKSNELIGLESTDEEPHGKYLKRE